MIPALQQFIKNPNDIDGLAKSIETQKKSIFTSDRDDDRAADRRPPAGHRPGGQSADARLRPQEPGAQLVGRRPGRRHADGGHPDAVVLAPRLVPGDRRRCCCPSPTGTASARSQIKGDRPARTTSDVATNYPPFWPALQHNLIWLAVLFLVATPLGMFLAVLLDKEMRFSRFYQTAIYLPVVLSPGARRLHLAADLLARPGPAQRGAGSTQVDWYGDPNVNLWAVAGRRQLAAHRLHHAAVPGRAEGGGPVAARGGRDRRRHPRRRRSSGSSSR